EVSDDDGEHDHVLVDQNAHDFSAFAFPGRPRAPSTSNGLFASDTQEGVTGSLHQLGASGRKPTVPPSSLFQKARDFVTPSPSAFFYNNPATPVTWETSLWDIKAAVTVSLVSVPLSIALSIAGGGTPAQGLVTAFWSGLFASIFGGSEWNIVGPTSALSGVLSAAAAQFGGHDILPYIAIHTAVVILIVWTLKLSRYLMFIVGISPHHRYADAKVNSCASNNFSKPSAVVHGFTLGVSLIMILGQFDNALGLTFHHEEKEIIWKTVETFRHMSELQLPVAAFFVVSFSCLLYCTKKFNSIPWHMVVTAIGIVFGYLSSNGTLPFKLRTLNDAYGNIPLRFIQPPTFDPALLFSVPIFRSSFSVVFIGILETLISARMADTMIKTTDHNQSKEVFGLATANAVAGLFGGLPATAALARTSLNIRAGSKSRLSALLAPFSLLIISLGFFDWFRFVPMATISAVLCVVAINMVEVHEFWLFWLLDMNMFLIGIGTAIMCLLEDTMVGLVAGSLLCLLLFTDKMSIGYCEMVLLRGKNPVAH
ncbi:hypothetical protein HDU93_002606, partial [Gonapodya sp. JEL0774]